MQLPWKCGHEGVGIQYDQALYRFQQSQKLLSHQLEVWKNYAGCIKEYEELGQMQLVSGNNGYEGKETFYLTHCLVIQQHISTAKLRGLFYMSARSTNDPLK